MKSFILALCIAGVFAVWSGQAPAAPVPDFVANDTLLDPVMVPARKQH